MPPGDRVPSEEQPALTLLFVCTHNRCRSILCEALTRQLARGRIAAISAGSSPGGAVHPDTLTQLEQRGIDTHGLRSTSWKDSADSRPDAVLTVCDSAAAEQCPLWLGETVKVHWGLPDPSRVEGTAERATAFDAVITTIERRIQHLLEHDLSQLRGNALRDGLQRIAEVEPCPWGSSNAT